MGELGPDVPDSWVLDADTLAALVNDLTAVIRKHDIPPVIAVGALEMVKGHIAEIANDANP